MSRVITSTVLGTAARRLDATPADQLDPVVRGLVERAAAEAYDRGLGQGRAQGVAEADGDRARHVQSLSAAVSSAVESAAREVADASDEVLTALLELAVSIAETVIGHEPHDRGVAISERLRQTIASLDDRTLVIRVNPTDLEPVSAALGDLETVTVEGDPSVGPGEARATGAWAEIDLTRVGALSTIRRELGVDR